MQVYIISVVVQIVRETLYLSMGLACLELYPRWQHTLMLSLVQPVYDDIGLSHTERIEVLPNC